MPPAGIDPTLVIDLLVQHGYANAEVQATEVCDDATFVRRIYLDLTGRIPTVQETEEFTNDHRSQKRLQLMDQLIASSEFAARMADSFDVMLIGRVGGNEEGRQAWMEYLRKTFKENRPWDQFAAEVLLAREGAENGGHLWFLYQRNDNHQAIAESISKGFFGVDIACAQCHDHPLADEIKQAHYWGLVSFFKRSKNAKNGDKMAIAESAIGGFDDYANALTGTTDASILTFLQREVVAETRPEDPAKVEDKNELYAVIEGDYKIPKFSRREKFVNEILAGHPMLARAMVNRVWGMLLGRGLVHPIEKMDSTYLPSHPELLEWLAVDFRKNDYDVQRLVRSIVRSQTYQLDSKRGDALVDPANFGYGLVKPVSAEATLASFGVALGLDSEKLRPVAGELRRLFPDIVSENNLTTLKQTLSLSNYPAVNQLIQEAAKALPVEGDLWTQVNLLYQRIYSRSPDDVERDQVLAYLQQRSDRPQEAMAQVLWAMVTSAEFRFNH